MKSVLFFFFTLFHVCLYSQQSIEGIWATYDDNTGKLESEVEIFIKNGKLYGKIIRLFDMDLNVVCSKCTDHRKNKPVVGMIFMSGLTKKRKRMGRRRRTSAPKQRKTLRWESLARKQWKLTVKRLLRLV